MNNFKKVFRLNREFSPSFFKKKTKLPLAKRKRVRKEQKKKGKEKFLRRTK